MRTFTGQCYAQTNTAETTTTTTATAATTATASTAYVTVMARKSHLFWLGGGCQTYDRAVVGLTPS